MNEKIHKVFIAMRWYVVVFLAGAILAGAALYFTAIKSGDKLISEYQRTTAQLAEDYQRVRNDNSAIEIANRDLTERLADRQSVLNRAAEEVDRLGSGFSSSDDIITTIIDEVSKLSDLLRNG